MATTNSTPPEEAPWRLYAGLSTPVAVVQADGRVVFLNTPAEALWGLHAAEAVGHRAAQVLRLAPPDGGETREDWVRAAISTETPLRCLVVGSDGQQRPALLSGAWMVHEGQRVAVVVVVDDDARRPAEPPDWAVRDPLTGLHNPHHWRREFDAWNARAATAVFFDLDDLKDINDLYGHPMGDQALAVTGHALAEALPAAALVVRYGGDEFVALLATEDESRAQQWATDAAAQVTAAAKAAGLPIPLNLAHGVAAYPPGGLQEAVRRADDALYERKGVLLRSAGNGRIVLTREGRGRVQGPGRDSAEAETASYADHFGPEWDGYFRRMFSRAAEHAREFVDFVGPVPGSAVVEVAAGSGRITFDGGLAARIGPGGQLVVTDPSAAQLQVARSRAAELGLDWLRFLQAPVEHLPLAAGTVDLVIGSTFLHFTDPDLALRCMARAVRPGGRVAVDAPVEMIWGPAWLEVFEPVRRELAAHGLEMSAFLPSRARLEAAFDGAGLIITGTRQSEPQRAEYPTAEITIPLFRQVAMVPLMLRGVPADRHAAVQAAMEARMREVFPGASADDRAADAVIAGIVAEKPE